MKPLLTLLLLMAVSLGGGPFDHTVNAFGNFKKPIDQIDTWDRVRAAIDHAKTDAIVAENGKNLVMTQGLCTVLAYQKAKSKGYAKQYRTAALWGNGFDIIDKGLTGGVISSQLEQVPFVGEYLSLLVPQFSNTEIIHSIPGYPQPHYSMSEEQYYWFQAIELALFWLELDGIKVAGDRVYAEVLI